MLQTIGDRALEDGLRPFTVIDVREGRVSETGNVTIAAIETARSRFAYRLGFEGRSLLIAGGVTYSDHLVARSEGVDIVVLRHSDVMETIKLLQRLRPRLAVLSPDGMPATIAQIRQRYAGPVQLLGTGAHRIHVRERLALDDDIKRSQR
jgi:predicted Fe-Mo cluster-binding NifX family protein